MNPERVAGDAPPGTAGFQPARPTVQPTTVPSTAGWRSRGYLPHFDGQAIQQVITLHLADSLPHDIAKRCAATSDRTEVRQRYEAYLDAGHGSCLLREPACAEVVQSALLHFDAERYRLLAWCVMPNHVHVIIEPLPGHGLAKILQSWKRHTAQQINRRLGLSGPLWRREYWDRFIRDERHFAAAVAYIDANPVKAGLVAQAGEWAWSSAFSRPVENRRSQGAP